MADQGRIARERREKQEQADYRVEDDAEFFDSLWREFAFTTGDPEAHFKTLLRRTRNRARRIARKDYSPEGWSHDTRRRGV